MKLIAPVENNLRSKIGGANRSRFLWILFFIKLAVGSFFASHYLTGLFLPFVERFVSDPWSSPYTYFYQIGKPEIFPYPSLMLYLISFPAHFINLFVDFHTLPLFAKLLSIRSVLIVFDLMILFALLRWLRFSPRKTVWLYWGSPVLFYISYVHGQLDVVPIGFLFLSFYLLFKEKWNWAAVAVGLSLATKTNVALALPFFCLYFLKRNGSFASAFKFIGTTLAVFFALNLPHFFEPAFLKMVFGNAEQTKVYNMNLAYGSGLLFYCVPAAYFLLVLKGISLRYFNRDIFIMLLGFSFGILLLFIPPMPGWYFWVLPFFIYFATKSDQKLSVFGLVLLQILYLLHFAFESSIGPTLPVQINNVVFTVMQTTLALTCFSIYHDGLKVFSQQKIFSQPFVLGIAGDSGAGKSTIAGAIERVFGSLNTQIIRGDDKHKWERGDENWKEITHLNPKANDLHQEILDLKRIKSGRAISRRHYDHSTGTFTKPQKIHSNKVVLVEGLHPFFLKSMRELYDLRVFVKTERSLISHWKIIRDTKLRGHSKEAVLTQIQKREEDFHKFIAVQADYADVIVEVKAENQLQELGNESENVLTYLHFSVSNDIFLEPLVTGLEGVDSLLVRHFYDQSDKQSLELKGNISSGDIHDLARYYLSELGDLGIERPDWLEGQLGLVQLVMTYVVIERARLD